MQTIFEPLRCTIDDIGPTEFAHLCWEAHPAVRADLASYLQKLLNDAAGAIFAARNPSGECLGRVVVEIHPGYTTRGKPCATFGWLDGQDAATIAALLGRASTWASRQKIKVNESEHRNTLLRGPISFPKNLGGVGCQVEGFDLSRMVSAASNRPELAKWVEAAGFSLDAPYACIDISPAPKWKSEGSAAKEFTLTAWDPEEWLQHEADIVTLASTGFTGFLPDSNAGRFHELVDAMRVHPEGKYLAPVALDHEGRLAGFAFSQLNLWEIWGGKTPQQVSSINVDSAIVQPQYQGRGISSALNGFGRVHLDKLGIRYYEGTAIWFANEQAVKKFFPHGKVVRKHAVFQKRLKKTMETKE